MVEAALILVNYNTSAYALDAVAALKAQDLSLEIIVLDNASRIEERERLRALRGRCPGRLGARQTWATAVHQPGAHADGGARGRLPERRREAPGRCRQGPPQGARAGRAHWGRRTSGRWDDRRTFLLPPIRLPTLGGLPCAADRRGARSRGSRGMGISPGDLGPSASSTVLLARARSSLVAAGPSVDMGEGVISLRRRVVFGVNHRLARRNGHEQ